MAILKIARMGHPVLLRVAQPVPDPTAPELLHLVGDMMETLDDIGGAGLAGEGGPQNGVGRLLALAESYPDLKANENFLKLQAELVQTENYLQFARRYYNGSVRDYNTMTETVPSNQVASVFRFEPRERFQKTADDVANVPLVRLGSVE